MSETSGESARYGTCGPCGDFTEAQRRTLAVLADGQWHRGSRTGENGGVLGVPALALMRLGMVERRGESKGPKPTASGYEYRLTPEGSQSVSPAAKSDRGEGTWVAHGTRWVNIAEQRASGWPDFHPEAYCHRCGRPNITAWFSPEWVELVGSHAGILCPVCFAQSDSDAIWTVTRWHPPEGDAVALLASVLRSVSGLGEDAERVARCVIDSGWAPTDRDARNAPTEHSGRTERGSGHV